VPVFRKQERTLASRNVTAVRKRRRRRKATSLARLLVSLDDAAREARPWRPRRVQRAALGTSRS
jgi:hypothetical protein